MDKNNSDPVRAKNTSRCTCARITHLPAIAFPRHNAFARRLGRGFNEYKVHRQRLYHLCRFVVNVGEVFSVNKKRIGSFFRYRSTDYVSLRRTKGLKDRKQNDSK